MTANQIRAARALLGLSQAEIAALAGVSVPTVKRAEGAGKVNASADAIAAIRAALEAAGAVFLPENGNGPGVALRKLGRTDQQEA
jgi:transcriptional regulator with XRE-family HTH domain